MALSNKERAHFLKEHRQYLDHMISEIQQVSDERVRQQLAAEYNKIASSGDAAADYVSSQHGKITKLETSNKQLHAQVSSLSAQLSAMEATITTLRRDLKHAESLNNYYHSVLYEGAPHPQTTDLGLPHKTF